LQCGRDARAAYHAGAETDPARYEHLVDASVCFERAGKWDSAWISHAMLLQRHPQSDAAEASRGALVRLTDAILDAARYRETLYGRRCLAPLVGGADAEATAEGSELVSVAICLQEAGALAGALAYRDKAGDRTETGTIDAQANAAVLAKLELTMRRLVQARDNDGIVEFAASPPT
jgi:hypothetical protein